MTVKFVHETLAQRVVFAPREAARALAEEVDRIGAERVMVIAAPSEDLLADDITAGLPVALRHHEVAMHVPAEVAGRAREAASAHAADAVVCVGGGSTTGLAKAIALTSDFPGGLPIVAVPTTYAGSEATAVWGITDGTTKTTGTDSRVLPCAVVYDASLTLTLPVDLSVASGLNALAHCVDSMWGPQVDPIDLALAGEGIRALSLGLTQVKADPAGLSGREQALYGAYLAAITFASAGAGLHHKICHVLGGMFGLPHAQTHAVVLPHVLALNAPAAPDAQRRIAAAFGTATAGEGLRALRNQLQAPSALRECGMPQDGIARAVAPILAAAPASNPAPVTTDAVSALLRAAWSGEDPQ